MEFYSGKNVVVTGGAGFLGSNLVLELVKFGAKVTIIDSFDPAYGANEFNLRGVESEINLVRMDLRDTAGAYPHLAAADVVFHFAAQCSHVDSITDPMMDLDYNNRATLSVLDACRQGGKKPAIVYASTRAVLGAPLIMPALESTLPNPVDIYGVNKHANELYGSVYARVFGIPFCALRLTNCFGPRHQMRSPKYGILNWFLSQMLQGQPVKIFGTGEQLRDYLYVSDAVDACLRAGEFVALTLRSGATSVAQNAGVLLSGPNIPYAVFNVASGKELMFRAATEQLAKAANGKVEFVPWPRERKAIETGDFVADSSAAKIVLGWVPKISFADGLRTTVDFYKQNLPEYL